MKFWILLALSFWPAIASAQSASQFTCKFEKIVSTAIDDSGSLTTSADADTGDMVLGKLNSDSPVEIGNVGTQDAKVVKRTDEAIWLVSYPGDNLFIDAPIQTLTLFFKTGVFMFERTEMLTQRSGEPKPFGFIEIGHCKPLE
jgi:hypothetical protein